MIKVELLLGLVDLVMIIFCVIECISTPEGSVRNLPKWAWILLILFIPIVGWVAWLVAGRAVADRPRRHERQAPDFPEYDRPGRAAGLSPESDEEFLRNVRERAEEQRKAHEAEKKRRQQDEESS